MAEEDAAPYRRRLYQWHLLTRRTWTFRGRVSFGSRLTWMEAAPGGF